MNKVVVSLDLFKGLKLMSKVARLSMRAVTLSVEVFALLSFSKPNLLVFSCSTQIFEEGRALAAHLSFTMSKLALITISTEAMV
jgi:hypothetical protein